MKLSVIEVELKPDRSMVCCFAFTLLANINHALKKIELKRILNVLVLQNFFVILNLELPSNVLIIAFIVIQSIKLY